MQSYLDQSGEYISDVTLDDVDAGFVAGDDAPIVRSYLPRHCNHPQLTASDRVHL
jgi:hypothetical protein